jgi:hypothetical protein
VPDYDSGWLKWQPDQILTHNLGTTELFVHVMYKNKEGLIYPNTMLVQWYNLNEQSIVVQSANLSLDEEFRIVIWKLLTLFHNFLFGSGNPI